MTYQNRRAPNVLQYIANLNAINPYNTSPEAFDESSGTDDLNLFATAQFFDFDMGASLEEDANTKNDRLAEEGQKKKEEENLSFMQSLDGFDYDFAKLLPNLPNEPFTTNLDLSTAQPSTSLSHTFIAPQPQAILPHPPLDTSSPTSPTFNTHKRKASTIESTSASPTSFEDASRGAADEDKRRRNTAASARFRIKKKQREQAMETHAKDLEKRCQTLEQRVNQLEMENKWLKNLITDKSSEGTKKEIVTIPEAGKKGVGTDA